MEHYRGYHQHKETKMDQRQKHFIKWGQKGTSFLADEGEDGEGDVERVFEQA